MRLYLSSYRLGDHVDKLIDMVGEGRRVVIIENALDNSDPISRLSRRKNFYDIYEVFEELGFEPKSLDLRNYFEHKNNLRWDLENFDLIWACGGNAFLLRRAMHQSGFDDAIKELLKNDAVAYGGFSAGACVLAPSLSGIELCDKPNDVSEGYKAPIIWDGLGMIDFAVAPHYRSDHPESSMIEDVVDYFEKNNIAYRSLRDGDVIVCNGNEPVVCRFEDGRKNDLDRTKTQNANVSPNP